VGIVIEKIEDNAYFEYQGDVEIEGNIGKNATVIIKDGDLIVYGTIKADSKIKMFQTNAALTTNSFFINSKNLLVYGDIENGVIISANVSNLNIGGKIGANCNVDTHSADIRAGDIESGATLKTINGDIKVDNVGANCLLNTIRGDIRARIVGSNAIVKSMSGDIKVQRVDRTASLETISGDIYQYGVKHIGARLKL
jgi:hypothetical protein